MDLQKPKSRWQESEWWLTVGAILLGILVKVGVISPSQSELAADVMNDLVGLLLVVAPVIGWQFTRTKKKIAERDQDAKIAEAKITGSAKVKAVRSTVPKPPAPTEEPKRRSPEPPTIT
jgi:hypothetical protein